MRFRLLAVLLASAMVLGACGGDDETHSGPITEPAEIAAVNTAPGDGKDVGRKGYIARADEVCERANQTAKQDNAELEQAVGKSGGGKGAVRAMLPALRKMDEHQIDLNAEFKRVEYPRGDRTEIEKIFLLINRRERFIYRLYFAADEYDVQEYNRILSAQQRLAQKIAKRTKAYGFDHCGQGPVDVSPPLGASPSPEV